MLSVLALAALRVVSAHGSIRPEKLVELVLGGARSVAALGGRTMVRPALDELLYNEHVRIEGTTDRTVTLTPFGKRYLAEHELALKLDV